MRFFRFLIDFENCFPANFIFKNSPDHLEATYLLNQKLIKIVKLSSTNNFITQSKLDRSAK